MVKVSEISNDQLTKVAGWFKHYAGADFPLDVMGDFGFMASVGDVDAAAVFFFPVVGANWCVIGWPVGNPELDKADRGLALDTVLLHAQKYAKELGYKYATTWASHKTIEDRFIKHGYAIGDKNVSHMVKLLGGNDG